MRRLRRLIWYAELLVGPGTSSCEQLPNSSVPVAALQNMSDEADSPLSTQPLAPDYLDDASRKPAVHRQPDFSAVEQDSPDADDAVRTAREQDDCDRARDPALAQIQSRAPEVRDASSSAAVATMGPLPPGANAIPPPSVGVPKGNSRPHGLESPSAEDVARARAARDDDKPTAPGQCGKCSAPDAAFSIPHTACSHRVLCSTCHEQLNPRCARNSAYAEDLRMWMCAACVELDSLGGFFPRPVQVNQDCEFGAFRNSTFQTN